MTGKGPEGEGRKRKEGKKRGERRREGRREFGVLGTLSWKGAMSP